MSEPTQAELSAAASEVVGGPDVDATQELPDPLKPDLVAFPWLA
ncbi:MULTISPECIES: hypothetical protein [unclassified Rhodococcus (in: high G+C Gram-positive bacteria)]|nr:MULTISPECIES: hypothetical protein [unclassified Rhodococcus (in: high G+C Gram-positive bacteria)]